ncbi:ThiF family adenylyltransferase [uncultured Flavobacterium sp.]|uniref:ThiF family adenylyltransferase n=1 Tax=uncultured Flavobacterium sp. TaxID=165435 RepID=UPI0025981ABF|nr:ThiF family adenylyltransferase [uncultured Flavobacterium sp.]
MTNFEKAREEAWEGIIKTNTVKLIQEKTKGKYGIVKKDFWEITVEISLNDTIVDFKLLAHLKPDFPLSLPEIYLSEEDYEKIKYIPHVDNKRSICLFDKENIKINIHKPLDILKECLARAKKIIVDGINKSNLSEFKDEITAYWQNTYHQNDSITGGYLGSGTSELPIGKLIVHILSPSYDKTSFFIGSQNEESKKIKSFFKLNGNNLKEIEGLYMGTITKTFAPPFSFTNNSLINFIHNNFENNIKEIESYLNEDFNSKILIFSIDINGELLFFGFNIVGFQIKKLKGWRSNSLNTVKIMSSVQPQTLVQRINFTDFSLSRIKKRTDGISDSNSSLKLLVAGLGSIGSNLLFYLSNLNLSNLILIDPEILQFENINRHLLSYREVGENKVDAIAKYISFNNPFIEIEKHSSSIIDVIQKNLESINQMDFLFCAIGKDSIETYILECLSNGKIEKPLILFWVEPYLLGAHVLYINPKTNFRLDDLEIDNHYKYNIISNETYLNPKNKLLLKEAGCQSSYIPYGKESIALFFSAFLPYLYGIIKNKPFDNLAFTYIGDLSIGIKSNLEISDFAKRFTEGQIIKQII